MSELSSIKKIVNRYTFSEQKISAILQFDIKSKYEKDQKVVESIAFISKFIRDFTVQTENDEIYIPFQKITPTTYFTRTSRKNNIICLYVNSFVRALKENLTEIDIVHYLSQPMASI